MRDQLQRILKVQAMGTSTPAQLNRIEYSLPYREFLLIAC